MSGIGTGAAALIGAAAPGAIQGIGNAVGSYQDYKADQKLDASTAAQTGGSQTGLADANHPVWGVLNNLTGNPGNAPLPGGGAPSPVPSGTPDVAMPAMPAAQMGAPIPGISTDANGMVNAPISVAQQGQMSQPVAQMATGGVVGPNYGIPTSHPSFVQGPMQGIRPASTEGQILTMDAGGVVPDGFHEQAGISGVPMSGRGASFIEGMQAGQNIGHNLQQAWHANRTREANAQYGGALAGVDVNNPDSGSAPKGFLSEAKDAVEGFFHHIHESTLDDNHQPNSPAPGSPNAPPPGAIPAPDAATPPGPGAAPPGPAASPIETIDPKEAALRQQSGGFLASGKPAPPVAMVDNGPGAGPSAGPGTPAAGAPTGGGAQPGQGQPQPVTPQQQATQNVTKQVAGSQQVRQGVPDKSPEQSGLPHSMTPAQWQHLNTLKQKAVMAAARAGEDPAKVYESLTAMQNAHFQGQILKQLGTANVAFQNGDMDAVKKALKNVNYYLPNGQDITFKDATAADVAADQTGQTKLGDPMYANPFYGMYGHDHEPQYTKIDAQHIQQLGVAALDPQNVQKSMLASYSAQAEAHEKTLSAQGAFQTGEGKRLAGAAAWQNSNIRAQNADVDRRLKIASGDKLEADARLADRKPVSNSGQPKITIDSLRKAQLDGAKAVDDAATGELTSQPAQEPQYDRSGKPIMGPDGKPLMGMSLSPVAGKTIHDPTHTAPLFQGMSDADRDNAHVLAGQINGANLGSPGMTAHLAAQMAARILHQQAHPTTHINPITHKVEKDLVYDSQNGTVHVWAGNTYLNAFTQPNVMDESQQSPVQSSGGSGIPTSSGGDDSETNNVLQE